MPISPCPPFVGLGSPSGSGFVIVSRSAVSNSALEDRAYRGAERYLGGRALEDVVATLIRLHSEGFNTGVDYLGEQRTDGAALEAATDQYVRLNRELARLDAVVNVWVDFTNVGSRLIR